MGMSGNPDNADRPCEPDPIEVHVNSYTRRIEFPGENMISPDISVSSCLNGHTLAFVSVGLQKDGPRQK